MQWDSLEMGYLRCTEDLQHVGLLLAGHHGAHEAQLSLHEVDEPQCYHAYLGPLLQGGLLQFRLQSWYESCWLGLALEMVALPQ